MLICFWLPVWVLGTIIQARTVPDGFGGQLQPVKGVFGYGGLVGAGMALVIALFYAAICLIIVVGEFLCAALWSTLVLPLMT